MTNSIAPECENQPAISKPDLSEYRQFLVSAEQKSQEDFDKTILSLSGGALGISFVFLKDVIGTNPVLMPCLLLTAWMSWAFSTMAVLSSFYLSHLALRRAIQQVDAGTIYSQRAGGNYAVATALLNAAGAALFFVGVCAITAFAGTNLSHKGAPNDAEKATITAITTPKSSSSPAPAAGN